MRRRTDIDADGYSEYDPYNDTEAAWLAEWEGAADRRTGSPSDDNYEGRMADDPWY